MIWAADWILAFVEGAEELSGVTDFKFVGSRGGGASVTWYMESMSSIPSFTTRSVVSWSSKTLYVPVVFFLNLPRGSSDKLSDGVHPKQGAYPRRRDRLPDAEACSELFCRDTFFLSLVVWLCDP